MKTKNIFKTLILAAVLVSACGKNEIADDFKGYTLPVTINVTRQGDEPATRASYNESTRKLSFSAGDKLFVYGSQNNAGKFAGTLDYDAVSGKFSGTMTTENEYTGTIDNLMETVNAFLLPAGYESYGFYSVSGSGYDATADFDLKKAFALTKAAAVEQFSFEGAYSYSSGFALAPQNAIVSFTISGLTANKKVDVSFYAGLGTISGNVTTSATGVATFAVGVSQGSKLENCTLTVGGNNITMPTKTTEAGKIYNISRSVPPAVGHALSASAVGEIVGTDGQAYAVKDQNNLPTGVKAEAVVTYKSGSNGFALALVDYPNNGYYDAASGTYLTQWRSAHPVSGCTWVLPTREQWKNTYNGCAGTAPTAIYPVAGYEGNMGNLNTYLTGADGTAMNDNHWTSTAYDSKEWVCTNSNSAANTCNFNRNDYDRNLICRYGIAF